MTTLRAQAAAAAWEWRCTHRNPQDQLHDIGEAAYAIGYEDGHATGVEEGARRFAEWAQKHAAFTAGAGEMARLVHDEMERCIGKARKAKEITRTARLRCEMGAVVGWIATLQEEMFINPETRLRASLPAQIVDEET